MKITLTPEQLGIIMYALLTINDEKRPPPQVVREAHLTWMALMDAGKKMQSDKPKRKTK